MGESFSYVMAQDPRGLEQGGDLVFQGVKEVHYDRMEALLGWNPRKSGLTTHSQGQGALISDKWSCSVMSDSLRFHELKPTSFLCPWNFPGKSTGAGCHFLLQGIFPTQGSNPGLPHCRQTLYHLSHKGSPGGPKVSHKLGYSHQSVLENWSFSYAVFPS